MAESKSVNADRSRKRVEAEASSLTLKQPKNNCLITNCEACNESVGTLISTDDCGLESKIKMNLETRCAETPDEVAKKLAEREDFRKSFNKANPDNKKVSVVGREGGVKWRAMSEEEKKPYTEKAAKQQEAHLEYWRIQPDPSPEMRKK
ncbi:high mobility group B protein 7-like [Bidens hawaiensis]|uniref:high mobility group B protein 7-like n=1 Tax=Bidens hawaiensis TaxID=980011 RepID=UPI00404920F1